MQSLANTK